ncbi:MAG: DUF86 domain-containing protein [Methanomassiliicoccaceae archaeon]|jgi:uncharacterized protein with HEPN domain|nr:DUF86 domain-containing protein [Methanomassiliicoccaceae archaeon]
MKDETFLLKKIIDYCDDIDDTITFFGNDEETFHSTVIFQRSCAFNLLQIGEIVKSLSPDIKKRYENVNWRGISGFRDIIAHNYGNVQQDALWVTITEKIPELRKVCEEIISERSV